MSNNKTDNERWLLSCPCTDGNFKAHLQSALATEILFVLNELPPVGNKTKISVLKKELRHRQFEVNTYKDNGEIATSSTFKDYYKAYKFYENLDDKSKDLVEVFNDNFYPILWEVK